MKRDCLVFFMTLRNGETGRDQEDRVGGTEATATSCNKL